MIFPPPSDQGRLLKPETHLDYSVAVDTVGPSGTRHVTYRIRLKVERPLEKDSAPLTAFQFTDYRSEVNGLAVARPLVGVGRLLFEAGGLPTTLDVTGTDGFLAMPFVAFALPADRAIGHHFEINNPLAGGLSVAGLGTVARGERDEPKLRWRGTVQQGEKAIGKLTVDVAISRSDAWPTGGEGSFTAPDGTVRFTFNRDLKN